MGHGVLGGHSRVGSVGLAREGDRHLAAIGHVSGGHGGGVHVVRVRVEHSRCIAQRLGGHHSDRGTVVLVVEVRDDWCRSGELCDSWWRIGRLAI